MPLLAIILSALIMMATTVAATTSLSSGLLLINNLAKNISNKEPNLSHKFGNGGLGCAATAGNNNNNIKSINDASPKKLKAG